MVRPRSLPELSQYPSLKNIVPERKRGKPSISLAAGLIMAAESPKASPQTTSPAAFSSKLTALPAADNLFYAYARRSDYAQFSPYLLTFVNADIAKQWWKLVAQEYPDSTREGTQLFTFKGDDIPGQIWDNQKFEHLRNKWFYSHFGDTSGTGGVIPLQDDNGALVGKQSDGIESVHGKGHSNGDVPSSTPKSFDFSSLQTNLEKMNTMIEENANQIKALNVAQSEGLKRMQEINEMNTSQIKSLAEGQAQMQSLVAQNASQFIALTNSQFSSQDQMKAILKQNAEHIKSLTKGQDQLASACKDMVAAITQLGQGASSPRPVGSPIGAFEAMSPPPRKLNRRVVSYTYEPSTTTSSRTSLADSNASSTTGK